ncbi:uncharacterized protein I303_105104 [Kwoniella dejecticola CBS 10117]|uniref:Uncharacterized protein n=1 Tax=Kwoniella dejecticola CBS 10117 TaxID=1296121 RepID=A0A1A6A3F8_9TREE|nr:uncharacterized protein I303_05451 [Kwoniella dejecticola CBS 10117]OBR84592.1 hypothetical protein I303_05451 [Kwoniella dejecticola CBS 10117]
MSVQDDLDTEIELIASSLLPAENLESSPSGIWPRTIGITSTDSDLSLHASISEGYPSKDAIGVEVKSPSMGRDEASRWQALVKDKMEEWKEEEDYPLYQLLTTHFLSILAPSTSSPSTQSPTKSGRPEAPQDSPSKPHHCLLISHHLLSSTKRKDLISLSSKLSLIGFSKTGHPGIMYSIGREEDLEEWIREVKSWNWLALRIRISPETIAEEKQDLLNDESKGKEKGARGGKGRGDWTELEKINEALDWLRTRGEGREKILIDAGVGGGRLEV